MVPRLSSDPSRSRRGRWLALATLAVVAAHALLFAALAPAWIDPDDTPSAPPRLDVRSVVVAAPAAGVAAAIAAVPSRAPPMPVRPRPPPARSPASAPAEPPAEAVAPTAPVAPADVAAAPLAAASTESAAPQAVADAQGTVELPVYATRLPVAGRWRYQLQRGLASGEADLSWIPSADGRYEVRLEGRIAGMTVLDWVSQGAVDAHGLAPERFSIRRRGRDQQAANFQRDAGKITFSGPTHELPLLPGVQDRLGWLLQLGAVIDAAPDRFGRGSRVVLMVVGARGGAEVWAFSVEGADPLEGRPALKLVREARRPRDTRVDIWLDPARSHLPMRALLTQPEGGPPLELKLDAGSTGP